MSAVEQFLTNLAHWGGKVPAARPERHGVEVLRDQVYQEGSSEPQHVLDVYRPARRDALLPVVFYVHGGGFRILSKDTHWIFGLGFARQGYIVFNVNYGLAPEHPFPAGLVDLAAAYQWVAANALRFGGDPSRMILAGESAGANLVTSLALATSCERPEPWARALLEAPAPIAVMPSCGLHQVSDSERFGRRRKLSPFITTQLTQISTDYIGAREHAEVELADPLLLLERGPRLARALPRFLSTVGTRDPILDDTRRLAAALDRLEVANEAHYYPGEGHAFQALVWRPKAKMWWHHTLDFMRRVLDEHPSAA